MLAAILGQPWDIQFTFGKSRKVQMEILRLGFTKAMGRRLGASLREQ
jgi:hypothetical protein